MLGLKLATDPRWVNIVEKNIHDILTDHAYCEQKAASNAISMAIRYPEYSELVTSMIDLAQEELEHFNMVHEKILDRGMQLGKEKRDSYVNDLLGFIEKGGAREVVLVDRLLFAAMVEARSCERFRLLSKEISDETLREFYNELMISEANHYTMFITFAKKLGKGVDVEKRWQEMLDFEAGIMQKYSTSETMHG
ncbi:MAG: tRNA-(ms[2]io[6]A)-hydroxylase [Sphingobacteriales bacterium]|jgi:tRNA-(ms[2]io[6]A)-hydroxylase